LLEGHSPNIEYGDLDKALATPDTQLRLFGKPAVKGKRRMGVALARGESIEAARAKANAVISAISVRLS
jgi:phosphoribosylglycinamide formyltransferase 2